MTGVANNYPDRIFLAFEFWLLNFELPMNKLLLYLIMLPSTLWKNLGADVVQLRAILKVRLLLDDRNPVAIGRIQKQKKSNKYGTLVNTIVFVAMGFFYMLPITIISNRIFSLSIYFSLLLTIITFMLITDFSNVLFDARDKYILFPRPVSDRTLVLARMLHVFIYLFRIVIPMSLPAWVMLGYLDGWKSATLFILPLMLLVCLVLFLVNSFYLLVLRLAKPEKFKDVINYFQVVTSIIFFASVYLLPRLFSEKHPHDFNILNYPWLRYLPPYWLAVCWSWIGYPVPLAGTSLLSILAVVFPLLCMYILIKKLAPQFSRRIAGIDAVDSGGYVAPGVKRAPPGKFYQKLAYAFNSNDDAKAGFMIAWLQSSRSRSFRMRVYPSFAFIPIYFFYLLTQNQSSISEALSHLADGPKHLLLLYMSSFVMVSALSYLTMSDQYKAAWVYYSTPVEIPGRIMIGAFKAIWVKFFLPFFIALSIFILYIWGLPAVWDIILALVNVTLFVSCIARISFRHLPFSIVEQMKQGGGRILKSFIVMIIPATLGFGHYFALHFLWLKLIFLVLSSIFLWLVWTSYAGTSWANMLKGEEQ
jgi:ABC-2 type transport system permease protein